MSPALARSSWARPTSSSSTTSTRHGGPGSGSPPTTRGGSPTPWSGRRPARRRGTTSPRYRGSGPSGPRSTCTIRASDLAGTGTPSRLRLGPPPVAIPSRGRLHEGRGVPVPGLRRVLRRVGLRLLVLLARSDRVHRARDSRRPGLPDRLLRAVYRAAAAPPARGRPGRRDTAGHGGTRVLQPAQLVAAVPAPGRRDRRDGRGDPLVAVPYLDAPCPALARRLPLPLLSPP